VHLLRDNHEFLEGKTATSVRTTVQDVLERNGKNIWLLGSGKVRNVSVERNTLFSSTSFGNGQGDTKDGVGTEVGLVGCAVELDKELVNLALVLDVDVLLNDGGSNGLVDVGDGLEDTLTGSVHSFPQNSFEKNSPFPPHLVLSPSRSSQASC
jgi:hypothetical protein